MTKNDIAGMVGFGCAGLLLLYALMGFFLMLAWNYVMPYLFDFKEISYFQAFALEIVAGALIKTTSVGSRGD